MESESSVDIKFCLLVDTYKTAGDGDIESSGCVMTLHIPHYSDPVQTALIALHYFFSVIHLNGRIFL